MRWLKLKLSQNVDTKFGQMSVIFTIVLLYLLAAGAIADQQHASPQQQHQQHQQQQQQHYSQQQHHTQQQQQQPQKRPSPSAVPSSGGAVKTSYHGSGESGGGGGNNPPGGYQQMESRNSYAMLSQAMSQAVIHEMSAPGSGANDGTCLSDDLECLGNISDRLGMEAIRQLHRQLDDDDNGNIDLTESNDFLREELKYDSGFEKRQRAFHYNDDMHISVKELWEAWLRSEVHNWTVDQTTEWLAQSVQLPQYVDIFKNHKVAGASLPRLAVNNMHYVGNVLGIRDPIHKQKIALKAMDVVLFGPPRETGTRWKDYVLVTLLLSAIIGCWYAYQQNKNAKKHLRRMAQDMEGLQKAEKTLQGMQLELEQARLEQENAASEKMDLLRRLKEAPSLSSSSSDLEVQNLKQEIEMLRSELSRAEGELVDHCWAPPQGLQSWLQLTYELESRYHLKKRLQAERQLHMAREACEKLRKKRSSLVGAFVSTHGKSIDDVDRSIVEARNALNEVTNELQERMHRWKQVEILLGFSIINNNGLSYLENILYNRNGTGKTSTSRSRMSSSQDDLDDESTQGMVDGKYFGEDSSASEEGDNQSVTFTVGSSTMNTGSLAHLPSHNAIGSPTTFMNTVSMVQLPLSTSSNSNHTTTNTTSNQNGPSMITTSSNTSLSGAVSSVPYRAQNSTESSNSILSDDTRQTQSEERIMPMPRTKKTNAAGLPIGRVTPMPPPRRCNSHQSVLSGGSQMARSDSPSELVPLESSTQASSTKTITDSNQTIAATATVAPTTPSSSSSTAKLTPPPHLEPDTYSTDSSSFDDEHKRRRRKLHFPFGKKKNKPLK